MFIHHIQKEVYKGNSVDLVYESTAEPSYRTSWTTTVYFSIQKHQSKVKVGEIDLRIGMNEELYYAGNFGYRIYEPFRGNHYALDACELLMKVAKDKYDLHYLLVTCSPDNLPSKTTLEELGCQFVKVVDVPKDHFLYRRGEYVKNIYEIKL